LYHEGLPTLRLSVLTLARGRRLHLSRLIEGLNRSTLSPNELIVVDMGGPPIDLSTSSCPIKVMPLKDGDLPLAKARNLAASAACNELLIFLDVDCIPMAGLVGAMRNALEQHDALVCAEIRYLNEAAIQDDWREDVLLWDSAPHPARAFPPAGMRVESNPGLFWSLAFGISAAVFKSIGGFDERFHGYGAEDTDFGFRAHKAGFDLLFLGGAGAFHQYHDTYDPPLQHYDDIIRNAEAFFAKWGVWPMQGWLESFERLQLMRRESGVIIKLRQPHAFEIEAAKQQKTRY
jgi:GT2 family glycosyltransferase